MRIAAHRGTRIHAPENSKVALLGAWVAGADVLEFDLQLTSDGVLMLSHDGTTDRLTGQPGTISAMTLKELNALDWSATFRPPGSPDFVYYPPAHPEPTPQDPNPAPRPRKLGLLTFDEVLGFLPEQVELLIELKPESANTPERQRQIVEQTAVRLKAHRLEGRTVVYSSDVEMLRRIRQEVPGLRVAAFDFKKSPLDQLKLLADTGADGLVTDLDSVLQSGALTDFGRRLEEHCRKHALSVGAVLYPFRTPGIFTAPEYDALRKLPFVWSISTDSVPQVRDFTRPGVAVLGPDPFRGKKVDTEKFAFGYAKANRFAEVTQADGVVLTIDEYPADELPGPPANDLDRRLKLMEIKALFAAKDWPYYSGGGVGVRQGILGDFSAEVEYRVDKVAQATTLEMAAVNVDPGAHVGGRPKSFRDKDNFYDPHGAPPFVGVEHDENDGFRINWNLGTDYDNNQYGRPAGDGDRPRGARLRLERRGAHWAAYFRQARDGAGNDLGPAEWVCVGVTRNDSMNPAVYLRCAAKRWRQERVPGPNPFDPDDFHPILANTYTFKTLAITRFIHP